MFEHQIELAKEYIPEYLQCLFFATQEELKQSELGKWFAIQHEIFTNLDNKFDLINPETDWSKIYEDMNNGR